MDQLEDLENIIDSIIALEDPILSIDSANDLIENMLILMEDYIKDNPKKITEPEFHDDFKDYIEECIYVQFEPDIYLNEQLEEDVDMMIDEAVDIFFNSFIPYRSYPNTCILFKPNNEIIENKLKELRLKPQPAQRTDEWYKFRHNLITASNAYKAFENQTIKNQLIFEKCQPLKSGEDPSFVNVNTTLHWGQKYEMVSVMIYEFLYNTKIEDFGCIQHETYKFIGASPDGINVDKTERFGRMLEIKNIVNREIDGIPKKEYWIQMQLQMEVCDLDECDFLETKFVEYESFLDFSNDGSGYKTFKEDIKGVIMYFSNSGKPLYKYKPIEMIDSEEWEESTIKEHENTSTIWIKNIYWKLEKMSCVLVLRNKQWFYSNVQELSDIWDIIIKERVTGFEHREPNKRTKKEIESADLEKGCLLNLNKETNQITVKKLEPVKSQMEIFLNL
jgi:putative phage-type endonuclease